MIYVALSGDLLMQCVVMSWSTGHLRLHSVIGLYFCFQAEDGIRYLVRSRGLGDVYKRQVLYLPLLLLCLPGTTSAQLSTSSTDDVLAALPSSCLLYTSDAADERSSVDLGGRRIIKKKTSASCDEM